MIDPGKDITRKLRITNTNRMDKEQYKLQNYVNAETGFEASKMDEENRQFWLRS
jgi:hypothetical protein